MSQWGLPARRHQGPWQLGALQLGERLIRLDGSTATVIALTVRPGIADYYNLTVSQVHTYAVGTGQYMVHNCGGGALTDEEMQEGAQQAKKGTARNYDTDQWKSKGVINRDSPWPNDDPRLGRYTDRYFYRFRAPDGDVKVTGHFDPIARAWTPDRWHLSGDQEWSDWWQAEFRYDARKVVTDVDVGTPGESKVP